MKNKNNKPRKIKNYLSSLSKWAKEHILSLFCLCCSLILLVGICASSCISSKKTTAQAQADISTNNTVYIVLPSVNYEYGGNTYYSTPMFISGDQYGVDIFFQDSGSKISYKQQNFINYNYNPNSFPSLFIAPPTARPHFFSSEINSSYKYFNLGTSPNDRFAISDKRPNISTLSGDIITYLYNYCSEISYEIYITDQINGYALTSESGVIRFDFSCLDTSLQSTPYIACSLYIMGLNRTTTPYVTYGQDFVCLSQTIDLDSYVENLLQQYYENGYNDGLGVGFESGYNEGLGVGYIEGRQDGIDIGAGLNLNPLKPFAEGVRSFFNIDLFGNFAMKDLFAIAMGCILFGFVVKMFLGG